MRMLGTYRKTSLLAFGEYVPGEELIPALASLNPSGGSFHRGSGPSVLALPWQNSAVQLGPQICYESLDPDFTRGLARQGAEILVNITNDSWFGPNSEPAQHMIMTLARAVETRLPMIRTTNTGITTGILADGTEMQRGPIGEAWSGVFSVRFRRAPPPTFYTLYGAWLPLVILLSAGLLVVAFRRKSRQK
jgi:apolipoprotein N-acyltransferase